MGCGASKEIVDGKVATTIAPMKKTAKTNESMLSKPVIPSIASTAKIGQSIAFEIPLDNLLDNTPPHASSGSLSGSSKNSLPKLELSRQSLQDKLANSEARWKVGAELDHLLYGDLEAASESKKRTRRKGSKPKLASKKEEDPEELKNRLLEKETAAHQNREKEMRKLQKKLALQEEHARTVLDRKKALGGAEGLNLSWGGEADGKGLADLDSSAESLKGRVKV